MDIYFFLEKHDISYQRFDHPAVFTCEESDALGLKLPGAETKNLFLRDKKGSRHFLVSVRHEKQVDLKALAKMLGVQNVSFASSDRLREYLDLEPGSVTLLGLVNDPEHRVEVIVDQDVWKEDAVCCHPLVNTATLAIPREGMEKFFGETGHGWTVMEVPAR